VLQAIERHPSGEARDGLIAYSLGNFLFPRGDHPPGLSGVLRVRYRELGAGLRPCLAEARFHPVVISRKRGWHPKAATGFTAEKVRRRIQSLSRDTRTHWRRDPDGQAGKRGEDLRLAGLRACPD
jgi:poly-gamma-glutamate synthesis protein (capsule biosynthesis protein)